MTKKASLKMVILMTLYATAWNSFFFTGCSVSTMFSYVSVFLLDCSFTRTMSYVILLKLLWTLQKCRSFLPLNPHCAMQKALSSVVLVSILQTCVYVLVLSETDLLDGKGEQFINHSPSSWHMICNMHSKCEE